MTMHKPLKLLLATVVAISLVACGGGGGDAGTSLFGPGSGSNGSGGTGGGTGSGTVAAYAIALQIQRAGVSTNQLTSTETVQAVATVTTSAGAPVDGVLVSFSESGGGLVGFAPAVATALTRDGGKASVDIKAADATKTGATVISSVATVGSTALSPSTQAIQINPGAVTPGVPVVPHAINFIGSSTNGTAIVIKGAGGSGRSESALLTFKIVDESNAPINGAQVDFALNVNNGGATLAQTSGVSASDGLVSASVSSGTLPASVVVTASAHSVPAVTSQSDTLLVSNSVPVSGAFEIVAEKYNLNGRRTGDSTNVSAFVADANGNPVPDGVAVSFQTDHGVVGSSSQGGCTTVNGTCSVSFRVQEPRGNGVATVVASVRVGGSTILTDAIRINMAGATGTDYVAVGLTDAKLALASCKQSFELALSDGSGRSTASGTTISSSFATTGVTVAIKSGSPVLDQVNGNFTPTAFGFEIDLTSTSLSPRCNPSVTVATGTNPPTYFNFAYTAPNGIVFPQRIELEYPH